MTTRRRHRFVAPTGSTRALAAVGLLALVSAGCGQLGGVHQRPITLPAAQAVNIAGAGAFGIADSGEAGGSQGPGFSVGASVPLGSRTTTVTQRITIPNPVPQSQMFTIDVPVSTKGPLYACPVQGPFRVGDDFGAPRYTGGYHPHAGNDMFADEGTPIAAPFDGVAVADPNALGGNAVVVRGKDGYVYNAHLSGYGHLGPVSAGDIVGYVGNTGDAQGTAYHDHFEWHPYAGPTIQWVSSYGFTTIDSGSPSAVDPYPYLERACPHS